MNLLRHTFAALYPAFSLLRKFKYLTGYDRSIRIRVLLYHDISPQEHNNFKRQLDWLSRNWTFISPEQFSAFMSGKVTIQNNSLLLTFDDGFASNLAIAKEILNPMGIKALFFVVSDLAGIEDREEAKKFIANHVQLGTSIQKLSPYLNNMKWSDLEDLLKQGHTIGAHTSTHARLSEIKSSKILEEEIISSADRLSDRLGVQVEHFAYTFGDLASISNQAFRVAQKRFHYIYSGLRGDNSIGTSSHAIRRDALKPSDSNAYLGALLEGGADFLYRRSLNKLDYWTTKLNC